MKPDLQQLESQNTLEQKSTCNAASDESSCEMTNEGCPNDPAASVSDATGCSGSDDETEQQQRF